MCESTSNDRQDTSVAARELRAVVTLSALALGAYARAPRPACFDRVDAAPASRTASRAADEVIGRAA